MRRGIFFGAIWGFLIGGLVLAVASLLGDVPGQGSPDAAVVEVPAGSAFDQAGEDRPVEVSQVPPSSEPVTDAPLVTAPEAPEAPTLAGAVTTSAAVPQTGGVDTLAPPPAGASDSGVDVRVEAPAAQDSGSAMEAPSGDAPQSPEVATEAAAAPTIEEEAATASPSGQEAEGITEAEDAASGTDQTAEEVAAVADEPVVAENGAVTEATGAEASAEPNAVTSAETPTENEATAEDIDTAGAATSATDEPAEAASEDTGDTERPEATAGGFGNLATGITVNRASDNEVQAADTEPAEADAGSPEANADPRALVRNAETSTWSGPDDRPLFSIVLIDEAGDAALLGALASFEGPLTFALPAGAPEMARRTYRDAGYEVAVIADIPEGAQPADVEVSVQATLNSVPEAMAVLDGSLSGFRGDRGVSAQVVDILAQSGHGLITVEQGLGTALQEARRAGVPTATIFRDLDQNGLGNSVIRRFLDQAAFRAGQDGGVVLLARMRPETISALLIWHKQDRASRVNLAPLSAKLLGGGQG
ncbi:MAG: divergent polysaccharide deacetylase family protein [Pseudomonadota bacterium]